MKTTEKKKKKGKQVLDGPTMATVTGGGGPIGVSDIVMQ